MFFKQFYVGCLAHASYLIGSNGEAMVVDPQRDVDQYLDEANRQGLNIKYVIETHLHADFVSGHCELASRTGAQIVLGKKAGALFAHLAVTDGDELSLGTLSLKILETPGHTPEGISILVADRDDLDSPPKLLTGDTLFIGDVGRPDLAGSKGYSATEMAGMMYDTLHEKLLKLDDRVEVYPAHGAGSLCGRSMSKETSSTIGEQRRLNYALKDIPKDEFIHIMTSDLPEMPSYFSKDAEINRAGAKALKDLPSTKALSPQEVKALGEQNHTILDVRSSEMFGAGHLPGAVNIGLGGQYASWTGTLFPLETPFIIVADDEVQAGEAVMRLARVGIENVTGYLEGGLAAWIEAGNETQTLPQMSVVELNDLIRQNADLQIVDVRRPFEYHSGHVPGALSSPLADLEKHHENLDRFRLTAVICAGGYRSSIGCSLLSRDGFHHLINIAGGTSGWIKAGFPVEEETPVSV